jgi:hypothetical protein
VSDSLQDAIKGVIASHRKPPRRLKSLLNGTWFGHPLHPVITDMPITAWMLTAVFAILWLISPAHFSWAAHGSHFCLHDGRVLTGPLTVNAPRYDVRMSNGQVEVKRL